MREELNKEELGYNSIHSSNGNVELIYINISRK